MPRNMSFAMTIEQYQDRTKTVTRRVGWRFLKPGHEVMGVAKGMGLALGEKVQRLHPFRTLSVRRERIDAITPEDVVKEGFPGMTPDEFVAMYCEANRQSPYDFCTRIEFEHIGDEI